MKYLAPYILIILLLAAAQPVFAQAPNPLALSTGAKSTTTGQGLFNVFSDACLEQGDCTMEDLVQLVVNIINFLLGIAGVIALLFFVYGGYTWIGSAGNSEKIESGKKILEGAVVGMLIVLGAWIGIRFVLVDWLGLEVSKGLRVQINRTPGTPPSGTVNDFGACHYTSATIPFCTYETQADCAKRTTILNTKVISFELGKQC